MFGFRPNSLACLVVCFVRQAIEASKEICSRQQDQLRECKQKLRNDAVQALVVRNDLGELLQATRDKLQTAQIDVVRLGRSMCGCTDGVGGYSMRTLCRCRLFVVCCIQQWYSSVV